MPISSDDRLDGPYTSGSTFPFGFKVFQASDVLVIEKSALGVETILVDGSTCTVTLNVNQDVAPGGSVARTAGAISGGVTITLSSQVDYLQGLELTNGGAFRADSLTDSLDRLTILVQQTNLRAGQSLQFPLSDGTALTTSLPAAALRASKALTFDASGNVSVSSSNFDTVVADATAQAVIATTQAGIATAASGTATTQAGIATTQATNAGNSATSASTSAGTAATAATTATTQAGIATAAAAGLSAVANAYQYSTTTAMADPGTGFLRLNNATIASATSLAISALTGDATNPNIRAFINTWDDSTTTGAYGYLVLRKSGAPGTFAVFLITGTVTDNTTWAQMTLSYVGGSGTFSNNDTFYIGFTRTGDKGATGGGGDFSTNTATSVDGEILVFNGTTGKSGKRFSGTGYVKAASGVASAQAVPIPIVDGGTGGITAAAARTALGLGTMATQAATAVAITGGAADGMTVGATTAAAVRSTSLEITTTAQFNGIISPTSLAVSTDNWAPTNLATANTIRMTAGAAINLTGLTAGGNGQFMLLENIGTFTVTLKHDQTSTAANRFYTPNGADFAIQANSAAILQYDPTSTRWRVLNTASGTSGKFVQQGFASYLTYSALTTPTLPQDDTIPQNTEGTQILSVTVNVTSATSILDCEAIAGLCIAGGSGASGIAIFGAAAGAIGVSAVPNTVTLTSGTCVARAQIVPGATGNYTITARTGPNSGTQYINGSSSSRQYGGVLASTLTVREILP